jgi:3-phosphoshikimate 1-carboxyvinyltransferase
MHERPQEALFDALRHLGYRIDAPTNRLPASIHGDGPRPGSCTVSIVESSQFASALLLASRIGGWRIQTEGENIEESPYVAMTAKLLDCFPATGGEFQIEPDASSGSYFWGAGQWTPAPESPPHKPGLAALDHCSVQVADWPRSGWQVDEGCPAYLAAIQRLPHPDPTKPAGTPALTISRQSDLGDSIMTAIVLAALANAPVQFTDLGRLRVQECERVFALRTELTRCGANVREEGDTLTVFPSAARLRPAEIETYQDHRLAMCFATLGLKVPGIKIKNPTCVRKTFPDFFQKLAALPPHGLGAVIRNPQSQQTLVAESLFAG